MTNKELTDLAAKALGIEIRWERRRGKMAARQQSHGYCGIFDPLNDSYDNMRLMAGCRITVDQSFDKKVAVGWRDGPPHGLSIACTEDTRQEATRRAVLRAAAEIGKAMTDAED